jgi:hypothetical protein
MEQMYEEQETPRTLAGKFGILDSTGQPDILMVKKHMAATGIDEKRDNNWKAFYRTFKDRGLEALENNKVSPEMVAKLAMVAANQLDKIEKRVQPNVQITDGRQVNFIMPPTPWGAASLEPTKTVASLPDGDRAPSPGGIDADFAVAAEET